MSKSKSKSKSKHTPGPWKCRPATDKRPYWDSADAAAKPAGTRDEPMIVVLRGELDSGGGIAYVWSWQGKGEMEANAHLIAAAPDLLAALRDVLCAWARGESPGEFGDHPAVKAANAALAAAATAPR